MTELLKKALKLIVSVAIPLAIGALGSIFTSSSVATHWYFELQKPIFNPPNWVFGPAWTLLYILIGISLFLVWKAKLCNKKSALIIFSVQLLLNLFWSIIFFGLHAPFYALLEIVILWIFIVLNIIYFSKISKAAAYLLIPYVLWVSFAGVLNFYIYYLNR
ncbi:MAG: tryptophan-rich sensory protein [Patescibacteria group bacterium]|nr:tryptophan-rich sensory protein [Patescibacteria group bacterium]